MAASLDARSPFLENELVEWCARLPDSMKLRGRSSKYLLRKAFEDELPAGVRAQRKQGFGIPLGSWFRGPLADWSRELLLGQVSPLRSWFDIGTVQRLVEEHSQRRQDHGKR